MEVLQKELVQVQTLMDSMTREREEESERLKNHYEQLQANYTTSEVGDETLMSCRSHLLILTLTFLRSIATSCCKHINMHTLHNHLEDCRVHVNYSVVDII